MERINVLFAIWSLDIGGAERVVVSLANHLDRSRFRPVICCLTRRGMFEVKDDVPVQVLNKKAGFDPGVIFKLRRLIREERIDIINSHMWTANTWCRIAAFITRTPVVVTEHNADTWKKAGYLLIDRVLRIHTARMIVVSDTAERFYRQKVGVAPDKIKVVTNGIKVEEYGGAPDREHFFDELGAGGGAGPVIGIVGRLVKQKGHRYLLAGVPGLLERFPELTFLIVGDGELKNELQAQVSSLGVSRSVHFLGNRTDMARLYRVMDLLVMPSLREAFPLTLLEALAAGCPVVATDVGGNRRIVSRPELGAIVPPRDTGALVDAASDILGLDNAGDSAAERTEYIRHNHSLEAMVRKTQDVLAEVIKEHR